MDQPPAEPEAPTVTTLPKADSNQNGNTNSDQYSDKEDGEPLRGVLVGWGFHRGKSFQIGCNRPMSITHYTYL